MLLTEVLPRRLWWGSLPDNPGLLLGVGVDEVFDLSDPDGPGRPVDFRDRGYHKSSMLDEGDTFDPEQFTAVAEKVVTCIERGSRVFVHCTFGKNRSGLVVALVLRRLENLSGADALERVRSLRLNAVNNPAYKEWLESLPRPEPGRQREPAAS